MPDKKHRDPMDSAIDFSAQSEEFLETFFKKGARFTEQLIAESQKMRSAIQRLQDENKRLRSQLASDDAVRDMLEKIKLLEAEKHTIREEADVTAKDFRDYESRYEEMERELDQMANLYVASSQLHATMDSSEVFSIIEQMLLQFVGVAKMAVFLRDGADKNILGPVHSFQCETVVDRRISLDSSPVGESVAAGVNYITAPGETNDPDMPIACIPILFRQEAIGAIVIYELLEQKKQFVDVDFELFRLLSLHAAPAIIGAILFEKSNSLDSALGNFSHIQ